MENNQKDTLRNVLSVVAGVLTGAAFFMLAGLILLLVGFSKIKRDNTEAEMNSITAGFSISILLIIAVCGFLGGFVTARISTRKDMAHGLITGLVMSFLLAYISEFNGEADSLVYYALLIATSAFGAWVVIRRKKAQF